MRVCVVIMYGNIFTNHNYYRSSKLNVCTPYNKHPYIRCNHTTTDSNETHHHRCILHTHTHTPVLTNFLTWMAKYSFIFWYYCPLSLRYVTWATKHYTERKKDASKQDTNRTEPPAVPAPKHHKQRQSPKSKNWKLRDADSERKKATRIHLELVMAWKRCRMTRLCDHIWKGRFHWSWILVWILMWWYILWSSYRIFELRR